MLHSDILITCTLHQILQNRLRLKHQALD